MTDDLPLIFYFDIVVKTYNIFCIIISNDLNNIGTFLMQKSIKTPLHLSKVSFTKRNIAFDIYKYRIIRLFDTISCILTIFDEMR